MAALPGEDGAADLPPEGRLGLQSRPGRQGRAGPELGEAGPGVPGAPARSLVPPGEPRATPNTWGGGCPECGFLCPLARGVDQAPGDVFFGGGLQLRL